MTIGQEYLTSNKYIAFPFVENALGLVYGDIQPVHGTNATIPLDFLIDAAVTLPSTITKLYLNSITRLDTTTFRFTFTDQTATTVFTYDLILPTLTELYNIIDMQSSGVSIYIRFVVSSSFSSYLNAITIGSTDQFQQRLPFECTVLTWKGPKIESFTVEPLHTNITDIVKLLNGYNTELVLKSMTENYIDIIINAAPGLGAGLYPCDLLNVKTKIPLNLIPDNEGGIKITSDDCYTIIPHLSTKKIEIQGNCTSCCDCQDYKNVGIAIKHLMDRLKVTKDDFKLLQEKLNNAVTAFNNRTITSGIAFSFSGSAGGPGALYDAAIALTGVNASSQACTLNSCSLSLPAGVTIHCETTPIPVTVPSQHTVVKYWHLKSTTAIAGSVIGVSVSYSFSGGLSGSWSGSITL